MSSTQVQPIPVGLATQTGLGAALAQVITAAVALATDQDALAIATFVGALLTLLVTLGGRFAQAAAQFKAVAQIVGDPGVTYGEAQGYEEQIEAVAEPKPNLPDADSQQELAP